MKNIIHDSEAGLQASSLDIIQMECLYVGVHNVHGLIFRVPSFAPLSQIHLRHLHSEINFEHTACPEDYSQISKHDI